MPSRQGANEGYIIDICDRVLRCRASRQHRFPFLLGDPDKKGRRRTLPVDAYYETLRLVIEVMESQHYKRNALMDDVWTISGMTRDKQRHRYDRRRRLVLPRKGIKVVVIDLRWFPRRRKRLVRDARSVTKLVRAIIARPS